MKFLTVTVALVSLALIFVLWDQTREKPEPVDASRFSNLATDPVQRSVVVDWLVTQVFAFCEQATARPACEHGSAFRLREGGQGT